MTDTPKPTRMPSPIPPGQCWTRSGRHTSSSGPGPVRCRNCGAKLDAPTLPKAADR